MDVKSRQIQKLYIAYFGRPADPSGINYWLINSPSGTSINDISKIISSQAEFSASLVADKSIEAQINYIHNNLFDRKVDFESINYWHYLIDQGTHMIIDYVCDLIATEKNNDNNQYQVLKMFLFDILSSF